MADGEDANDALMNALAIAEEQVPAQVIDLGQGVRLIVRAASANVDYQVTEQRQSITPEMAAHQQALAQIEADKAIKVAELTHVAPAKVMTRPVWVAVLTLGGVAVYALHLGKDYVGVAIAALSAMAGLPLIDGIIKKLKKPAK